MSNDFLASILGKAKALERSYDWLDAADYYEKASELSLQTKNLLRTAEQYELLAFCFYRAAFQAQSNVDFKTRLEKSIQAYEKEISLLMEAEEKNKQMRIKHAKALIAYTQSLIYTDAAKKKEMLDKWWILEHQALKVHENIGDLYSVGRTCNDLTEFSDNLFFLTNDHSIIVKLIEEKSNLVEKAINIFSKLDDSYELARAYCIAANHYKHGEFFTTSTNEIIKIRQKCQNYSKKALDLAKKTGDARLVSWAYASVWTVAHNYNVDRETAVEFGEKSLEYARITKDTLMIASAYERIGMSNAGLGWSSEDPDKQRASFEKAIKMGQKASEQHAIINNVSGVYNSLGYESRVLMSLAATESKPETKQNLIEKAIEIVKEGIDYTKISKRQAMGFWQLLGIGLRTLSATKSETEEKRKLLQDALTQAKKYITLTEKLVSHNLLVIGHGYFELARVYDGLAEIAARKSEKIDLLSNAAAALENGIKLRAEKREYLQDGLAVGLYFGRHYARLGEVLQKAYFLTKEDKQLVRAVQAYKQASHDYEKAEMTTHVAESYWHTAQLNHELGKLQEASKNYEAASQAYDLASKKIPQLEDFYKDYSLYMQAWSQIEQARYNHSIEEYDESRHHYEMAAKLHESTNSWNHFASNYLAWANIEEAESLSRRENTQLAKQTFQKALKQFTIAQESIKQKLEEIKSSEEKEMVLKLSKASSLRRRYCQARILVEEAKLLDRKAKYLQSSRKYSLASEKIEAIIEESKTEAERKELGLIAVLCRAWEKIAVAEETTSSEAYLEAASLFEQAKGLSITKSTSLWALGNSSFCRGLAAGIDYQSSLDLKTHAMAKGHMKSAATNYFQAGFRNASEYAKATQRLFDAYVFMNQAEGEVDPEKRAKQYQMAENLLQVAAGSFIKAKQPEKAVQVKGVLATVREDRAFAASLNEVMHAPSIASTTLSFAAPTPTNEVSAGLEQFKHANVQANIIAGAKEVRVGESISLTIEFVNAGKEPALLTRVEDFIPKDFTVFEKPKIYRLEGACLNMKGKQLAPLKLVEATLILQPSKKGMYQLKPKVHYLDEIGQKKTVQLKTLEIKAEEVILADRLSTGTNKLNSILLGGIPEEYAVVLTGPPSDERKTIINNFLHAGTEEEQVTFYVSSDLYGVRKLLENPNFYFFLCNLKLKDQIPDRPNVYKLHGKTDLNNLGIALVKAYRSINPNVKSPKRICVNILSDVLVNYGVKATRKWISELITNLGSKGFTMLAVFDVGMHPVDEANAVLGLFDGEISLYEIFDEMKRRKSVQIKKLRDQDYIENPICLTKQR